MRQPQPPAEAVPDIKEEVVASREPFFDDGISLDTHYVLCGDKRGAIGIDDYVHLFGGGLNTPYNLLVLQEVSQPGSVTKAFDAYAGSIIPIMQGVGINVGVHSDRDTEQSEILANERTGGPVGCVYARERPLISRLIADRADEIVGMAVTLRPELFQHPTAQGFAYAAAGAHGRLADREGVVSDGRSAVLSAASNGAKTAVVHGESEAKAIGIINLGMGSIKSGAAMDAGLPAYVQDSRAAAEIFDRVYDLYPQGSDRAQIAELIDTVGTFLALGIPEEDIAVRR